MSLKLYYHPLASFCWKVLVALYENETPFEPLLVDLGDAASAASFKAIWPIAKFPVLRDDRRDRTVPESTIIIEYLAQHHPGKTELLPRDPERALDTRLRDRFFDAYVHEPMQKIVLDRLRPADKKDPLGVDQAKNTLTTAYEMLEREMKSASWAVGQSFTMADCAAAPALYYADMVFPLGESRPAVRAYLARLRERPSFARVLREAQPYFAQFPR